MVGYRYKEDELILLHHQLDRLLLQHKLKQLLVMKKHLAKRNQLSSNNLSSQTGLVHLD
jgi:hypothetical protein